eukprot:jgi/Antlo1/1838/1904
MSTNGNLQALCGLHRQIPFFFKSAVQMTIKCTLVGDSGVGKTMLVNAFLNFRGPKPQPTLVDNYTAYVFMKNNKVRMSIWDTGGNPSNKRTRSMSYQQSNVFVLCYAVNDMKSFINLAAWYDEVSRYSVPMMICGMKCDEGVAVPEESVNRFCKKYGIETHVCCSAMDKINTKTVFEKAALVSQYPPSKRRRRFFCC